MVLCTVLFDLVVNAIYVLMFGCLCIIFMVYLSYFFVAASRFLFASTSEASLYFPACSLSFHAEVCNFLFNDMNDFVLMNCFMCLCSEHVLWKNLSTSRRYII